jgi:hypothetical protein
MPDPYKPRTPAGRVNAEKTRVESTQRRLRISAYQSRVQNPQPRASRPPLVPSPKPTIRPTSNLGITADAVRKLFGK